MATMKEMKKTNIRLSPTEYQRVAAAARRSGTSVNQYIVAAALEYDADSSGLARVEALVSMRLAEQTAALADALAVLAAHHDEHDAELRAAIKDSLGRVVGIVQKGAGR